METSNKFGEGDVESLRAELEELKHEVTVIKRAVRNKIARYEIGQIRNGRDIDTILDLQDL